MTKTQQEYAWLAAGIGAVVLLFVFMKKPGAATQETTGGAESPVSDQSPYYLTYNMPSPGASNYGAPYYGPIAFNTGCGCDGGTNNVTPQQIAQQTGNNTALTSGTNIIPGYIMSDIEME